MKTMQEFYERLAPDLESSSPDQHRLTALTRFSPAKLADISGQATWWIWNVEQTPDEPTGK